MGDHPWTEWAEGVRPLGTHPVAVGVLHVASGDVVGRGEPEDDFLGPFLGDVLTDATDDDGQLPLVVQVRGCGRPDDGLVRSDDRGVGLEEEQRPGWDFITQLTGMFGVVTADSDDLGARNHRRQQPDVSEVVTSTGVLNRSRHWISSDAGDGVGMVSVIGGEFNDPEGGVGTSCDKPGNTHGSRVMATHDITGASTHREPAGTAILSGMTTTYSVLDLIRAKRGGQTLDSDQIRWLIRAYTDGVVADEQMSAMAMAVFFQGLDDEELSTWTTAMIESGERMSFKGLSRPTVDKHSTGGVGDKITLPLAPLVAACGAAVPQLSGRGLGHTGGTLDKMEAIPGWRADLSHDEMVAQLDTVGAVICAAGPGLAPADKKLYALRDVTGTVESIPLIASSIMSKKIAEGTDSLVLDVKTGSGAFMKTEEDARELARRLVGLGESAGVRTTALLTRMDVPLGYACGNGIEVAESLEVLSGGGPADVVDLTVALARQMVKAAGLDGTDPADVLASGKAMDVWRDMVRAQGGDPDAPLPVAHHSQDVIASEAGVVTGIDAMSVGLAAWRLGAGRARKEDPVQAAAGVMLRVRPGDRVVAGQPLATLLTDTADTISRAEDDLTDAFTVGRPFQPRTIVVDTITA